MSWLTDFFKSFLIEEEIVCPDDCVCRSCFVGNCKECYLNNCPSYKAVECRK